MLKYLQSQDCFLNLTLNKAIITFRHIPSFAKNLAFCWEGECYMFLVLRFALSSAPYIFTKMIRCILKYLRSLGIRIAYFLVQHSKLVQEILNPLVPDVH